MKLGVGAAIAAIGLVAGSAAFGFGIRGSVVSNGGLSSTPASNGVHGVYGTVGQPAVGIIQNTGSRECSGFWCFGGSRVLAVDPGAGSSLPTEFALGPASPNPTKDQARFDLALPKAALVTLTVFDVSGRKVGDAISRRLNAGEHQLFWRAPDAHAGMYFMRLSTDGILKARRTIVLTR